MLFSLTIGSADVAPNEQLVLRSLIRLLNGRHGLQLQYSEVLTGCNVVFVPANWPRRMPSRCVTVRVTPGAAETPARTDFGLTVAAPLRMSQVVEVLRLAAGLLSSNTDSGLTGLFRGLTRSVLSGERRVSVLPLLDGRSLIIDFSSEQLWTRVPMADLLADGYSVGEIRRATPEEMPMIEAWPSMRLRDLIWNASYQLGVTGAASSTLHGAYRLVRWPDAVALLRPGYPRLCALLTNRALTLEQVSRESGLPMPAVHWFIETCIALGLAVPSAPEGPAQNPAADASATPATSSVFRRLRERLKLW